ncbi:MAG TPA: MFS transporter [Candidatus Lambdaproteobacteria bacterium]|nr:MFS transporter [Candidatus Lambdaproteobacteria bacterium]
MSQTPPRVRFRVFLLTACFALTGSVASLTVSAGSLIGYAIAENKALATLPLFLSLLGTMSAGIPASLLMRRVGRRNGFLVGTGIGTIGAFSGAYAILIGSFPLFCVSTYMIGLLIGFNHLYRFTVVEIAGPEFKAKAISLVMAGGIVGGLIGPTLAMQGKDWVANAPFAGGYLAVTGLFAVVAGILAFLDLPRPTTEEQHGVRRPLAELIVQPNLVLAVVSAALGYAVMALVMTATPLAMTHREYLFSDTKLVIQWHIVGMFLPSFVTGSLIQRFGATRMMMMGVTLNLICIALNLHGETWWHFWAALILLGTGWNFMFISGTTLLTETYRPAEKALIQGINDFLVFGTAASASLLAGVLLNNVGWRGINWSALPILAIVVVTLLWYRLRQRSATPEALAPAAGSGD